MIKPYFTRKNFIKLSLVMMYSFVLLFTGVCLDVYDKTKMVSKNNPVAKLGQMFFSKELEVGTSMHLCIILIAIYVPVFAGLFLYERQYAIVNGKKKYSPKMLGTYALSFLACLMLSLGVGILIQRPFTKENIGLALEFVGQTMILGTIIYIGLFALVGGILMFVVNFLLIDKPFKSLDKKDEVVLDDEELISDVTANFDVPEDANIAGTGAGGVGGGAGGAGGGAGDSVVRKAEELDDREKVFPGLSSIDVVYDGYAVEKISTDNYELDEICVRFRNYLAKVEKLYYELDTIRYFISGLAASKFMILEGLSGTGKSSLPRYFAKFIQSEVLFVPVQATWRDKSNLIGYFNDFSKIYTETEFLEKLYSANYNPDKIHVFVLDEMNISRIEYYFADFLSILEYPVDERRLKIMQFPYGFVPPAKLEEGYLQIPANCYFVGTANKDDSTFTITDKVYDRAITIDFDNRNDAFIVKDDVELINVSYSHLQGLYDKALSSADYQMTQDDLKKFTTITDFIYDKFDITFGNRILTQIMNIVPVFMACGGKKEDALDFLLSRKVISKIEGRFEDYVKVALKDLVTLMEKTYGAGVLHRSEKTAKAIMRRL